MATTKTAPSEKSVVITAPNFKIAEVKIRGTAPYVQHRFWKKGEIMRGQQQGNVSKSKKKREPRDFDAEWKQAMYVSEEGWPGMPASAFRKAMIRACSLVNFKMVQAKMSVFVQADGDCVLDGEVTPLVRIIGEPEMNTSTVRNATGVVDIRARPMWRKWEADLRIEFDADQFSAEDVTNLLMRVGIQVGVGEGRPFSKSSDGNGWGTFELVQKGAA